jgi:hypothetical protein
MISLRNIRELVLLVQQVFVKVAQHQHILWANFNLNTPHGGAF